MDILDEYLVWYNEKRLKLSLGAMSPLKYRRTLGLPPKVSPKTSAPPFFVNFYLTVTGGSLNSINIT